MILLLIIMSLLFWALIDWLFIGMVSYRGLLAVVEAEQLGTKKTAAAPSNYKRTELFNALEVYFPHFQSFLTFPVSLNCHRYSTLHSKHSISLRKSLTHYECWRVACLLSLKRQIGGLICLNWSAEHIVVCHRSSLINSAQNTYEELCVHESLFRVTFSAGLAGG